MISGASEEKLIEAIGRADVLLEFMPKIKQLQKENKKQKEVIDKVEKILNECKLLMTHEFDWEEQVDNALDILKEMSK